MAKLLAATIAGSTIAILAGFIAAEKFKGLLSFREWLWSPTQDGGYYALLGALAGAALFIVFGKFSRA